MNNPTIIYFSSGHAGLVDDRGRELLAFSRENSFGSWSEGRLLVKRGNSLHLMRDDLSLVELSEMSPPTEALPWFSEGLMPMSGANQKIGYIDREGTWQIAPSWDWALDFRQGFAIVASDHVFQLINPRGSVAKEIHSLYLPEMRGWPDDVWCFAARHYSSPSRSEVCVVMNFESIIAFPDAIQITDPYQGLLGAQLREGEWHLRTLRGTRASDTTWASLFNFSCGLAVARSAEGMYGAITTEGMWRLPPEYEYMEPFRYGLSVATREGENTILDTLGRTLFTVAEGSAFVESEHILLLLEDRTDILELDGSTRWSFRKPASE